MSKENYKKIIHDRLDIYKKIVMMSTKESQEGKQEIIKSIEDYEANIMKLSPKESVDSPFEIMQMVWASTIPKLDVPYSKVIEGMSYYWGRCVGLSTREMAKEFEKSHTYINDLIKETLPYMMSLDIGLDFCWELKSMYKT